MKRRGLRWLAVLLLLAGASGASWWFGSRSRSPAQAAAEAAEPVASWVTAAVEQRVLSSTVVMRGDVRSESVSAAVQPVSVEGAGIITRLPPEVGAQIAEGDVAVEVSGRPVFVLQGAVPAFRSLKPGMSGADVRQLQAALARLGHAPDRDGVFGERTKAAVTALYTTAGYDPVPSTVTAAQVDQAKRSARDAQVALAAAELAAKKAEAALQTAQKALNTAVGTDARRTARDARDEAAAVRDQAVLTRANAAATLREATTAAFLAAVGSGPTVAQGEVVFVPSLPARVQAAVSVLGPIAGGGSSGSSDGNGAGGGGGAGGSGSGSSGLVQLSGGRLTVVSTVPGSSDGLLRTGMAVELLDEATNTTYSATVADLAQRTTVDASGQTGRRMVAVPDTPLPAELSGANLRLTLTAAATEGAVMVVPLAAVSSSADGTTRVSVLAAGAAEPVDVPVTAGLSADGFVAVEPVAAGGLKPGDRVVVGR